MPSHMLYETHSFSKIFWPIFCVLTFYRKIQCVSAFLSQNPMRSFHALPSIAKSNAFFYFLLLKCLTTWFYIKWIINLSPHDYNANDDHNAFEQQDVKDPMHWDGKIDCNNSDYKMKYNGGNHVAEEDY